MLAALNTIVTKILAVNSVFASVALPVSVNQRGSYLNQVYLGVFRPDAERAPNWVGNLKQYQLEVQDDARRGCTWRMRAAPPQPAAAGNFISPTAMSFWTTVEFLVVGYYPNSQGLGGVSDAPDGDLVEKGGVAQKLRETYATSQATRNVYTCNGTWLHWRVRALVNAVQHFGNTALNADTTPVERRHRTDQHHQLGPRRQQQARRQPQRHATDIRGFIHGDVIHSRPVVINYNRNSDDVYVFYGANDGLFRAVKGGQASGGGEEQWAFVPTEGFSKLKRLRDHSPDHFDAPTPKPYFIDGSPTVYTYSTTPTDGTIDHTAGRQGIPVSHGASRRPIHLCAEHQQSDGADAALEAHQRGYGIRGTRADVVGTQGGPDSRPDGPRRDLRPGLRPGRQ